MAKVDILSSTDVAIELQDMPVGFRWCQHVFAACAEIQSEYALNMFLSLALRTELAFVLAQHLNIINQSETISTKTNMHKYV